MRVKVPPARLRYDSLSAHTDQTWYLEGEAGNRAQSDIRCGVTLALMGCFHGETEPKKATYEQVRAQQFPPDFIGDNSRHVFEPTVVRVLGIQWLNWLHLTKQNNHFEGTKRNELKVKGATQCRLNKQRNSFKAGRTARNWAEAFRIHKVA